MYRGVEMSFTWREKTNFAFLIISAPAQLKISRPLILTWAVLLKNETSIWKIKGAKLMQNK